MDLPATSYKVSKLENNSHCEESRVCGTTRQSHHKEIDSTKAYIRGSIADMQSLLVDVGDNVPKEEEFFKKVEDERIRDRCNFRKVCD